MPQEKKLQPSALTVFAQHVGIAKQFGNAFDHRQRLVPSNERVQARSEIGFGGKATGNAKRKTNLWLTANFPSNRGEPDVIDLGIRAPHAASGNRNFELARQIVEVGISR